MKKIQIQWMGCLGVFLLSHAFGHPNYGEGPAPLTGTHHPDRLMYSNPFHQGPARKQLLVKGEWDVIDQWLVENVDEEE